MFPKNSFACITSNEVSGHELKPFDNVKIITPLPKNGQMYLVELSEVYHVVHASEMIPATINESLLFAEIIIEHYEYEFNQYKTR